MASSKFSVLHKPFPYLSFKTVDVTHYITVQSSSWPHRTEKVPVFVMDRSATPALHHPMKVVS